MRFSLRIATCATIAGAALIAPSLAGANHTNGIHWQKASGDANATMQFVDKTGSKWPVFEAQAKWDQAPKVNVRYTSGSCSSRCVSVNAVEFAPSPART